MPKYLMNKDNSKIKLAKRFIDNKGFAMLFAVLTSSVILSIGLSIFTLTLKELTLSSSVRESNFAFYAATAGYECALFQDFNEDKTFSIPDPMTEPQEPEGDPDSNPEEWEDYYEQLDEYNSLPEYIGDGGVLSCFNGVNLSVNMSSPYPGVDIATNSFEYNITHSGTDFYCLKVDVYKIRQPSGARVTTINSSGYNIPCNQIGDNPNAVERTIQSTYSK